MKLKYIYSLESHSNIHFEFTEPYNLQYICYHISFIDNYPFLQIMLHLNTVSDTNGSGSSLGLPCVSVNNDFDSVADTLIREIKREITQLQCTTGDLLTIDAFKGIINGSNDDDDDKYYGLIDLSCIDINFLHLSRKTTCWFVLPTEIINTKSVCNIPISQSVVNLFTFEIPELSILRHPELNYVYTSPDAVYTGSDYKKSEFQVIFGPEKTPIFTMGVPYYPFYNSFVYAVSAGGWMQNGDKNTNLVDNKYGRYVCGGITRYAVFMKKMVNLIYNEVKDQKDVFNYTNADTIVVQYATTDAKNNVFVKCFEQFIPLSYHMLDKNTLGDQYDANADNYRIV